MEKPLHGVRVLDLTQVEAGPIGCSFLCDLGAEVIRVESTKYWQYITRGASPRPSRAQVQNMPQKGGYPGGDPGERPWNRYGKFHSFNRGKLSFTVDLTRPEGRDILLRLAKISDILIDGNAPDVTKKMGVDYAALSQVNPGIIYVGIYGFGSTGPYGGQPSMGPLLGSFIGHDLMRGYADSAPLSNGLTVNADPAAGAMAGLAAVQALIERRETGKGQYIEVGIGENFLSHLGQFYMDTVFNGRGASPLGNRHASFIQGCYPCRGEERWVAITIEDDAQWEGFCVALGNPAWTREERFGDVISRRRNQDALDERISEWTQQQNASYVMRVLQANGVAAAALLNPSDAYADPQLQARGYFQPVTSPEVGTYLFPGPPWRFSESSNAIERPSPALGEHNEYVYKELLGFSDEEYRRYEELGHIGDEPPAK